MARSKDVLPAAASVEFQYHYVADMPWPDIERAAGKSFTPEERGEIFYCAQGFDWEQQLYSKAPALREVDKLREELLSHCRALVRLAKFHQPVGRDRDDIPKADVVSALQIYCGTESFDFRESFDAVAVEASKILTGLKKRPNFEADSVAFRPETPGLTAFLQRVIDGATASQARSTPPGIFKKTGFEYRRWGIAVGPRVKGFHAFSSAVLSRPVTEGMLRKAWPSH
jgi:hypothetical protein